MNFKIVVSDPKSKKAYQKEIDQKQSGFVGRKIKDKVKGETIGLPSYELEITGGSDKEGFPMRRDVDGTARKKILLAFPPGFHPERKGQRKRKSVRGNTVSFDIMQINTKVVKPGPKSIGELWEIKAKEKEKKPEKKEEKPKEARPEKKEGKPAEKGEAKPKGERPKKPKEEEKPLEKVSSKAEAKMGVKSLEEVEEKAEEKTEKPKGEKPAEKKSEKTKEEPKKEEKK